MLLAGGQVPPSRNISPVIDFCSLVVTAAEGAEIGGPVADVAVLALPRQGRLGRCIVAAANATAAKETRSPPR